MSFITTWFAKVRVDELECSAQSPDFNLTLNTRGMSWNSDCILDQYQCLRPSLLLLWVNHITYDWYGQVFCLYCICKNVRGFAEISGVEREGKKDNINSWW